MKYTYRWSVEAPVEAVYENVLSAERWLSFVTGYQGLESGDPNWPNTGSSIVVRFGLGPLTAPIKVTVVEHEPGRRFCPHEDAYSGLYIDNVDVTFEEENGVTKITMMRDLRSKFAPIRLLILLGFPISRWLMPRLVIPRVKAMIERPESS